MIRRHHYDTTNARVKTKNKFEYKCTNCNQQYFMSSVCHNRIRRGSKYCCRYCGRERGPLVFVQALGQRTFADAKKVSDLRKTTTQPTHIEPVVKQSVVADGTTNVSRARKIYEMYSHLGRGVCIRKMVEVGIKDTTSSTYYQNFKSGKW